MLNQGFFGPAFAEMYVFDPASGAIHWNKPYDFTNAIVGVQRSGVAIADEADNAAGVVMVTTEGAGWVHGMRPRT